VREIIEWLIGMEHLSGEVYSEAAVLFKEDKEFAELLKHLAEDEAWHFHVMASAAESTRGDLQRPSAVMLNNAAKTRLEAPFREARRKISSGALTKNGLLDCIATTEFSEWNDIFLYVVNMLKEQTREFTYVASKLEQHKKLFERYFEKLSNSRQYLDKIQHLPKVWDMRILVVEDYAPIRELLSEVLASEGAVETVENGQKGLSKATEQYYDIIVADGIMPDMNGMEFFRQAVQHDPLIAERFLLLADFDNNEHIDFAKKNKVRYLTKPFSLDELRDSVHEVMAKTPAARRSGAR
jgi:CheY-like chemotaxis protein